MSSVSSSAGSDESDHRFVLFVFEPHEYTLLFNYFYKLIKILIIVVCRVAEQRGTSSAQRHRWRAYDLRDAVKDVGYQIRRTQHYFCSASGSLVCLGKERNDRERRFDRAGVHRSKEIKMYMNTILPNIERRAFVESDAASRTTKPGAGYDAAVASWRRDVMHSGGDNERSAP
jgi:hypothetical protein